jgi:hypothetical protein
VTYIAAYLGGVTDFLVKSKQTGGIPDIFRAPAVDATRRSRFLPTDAWPGQRNRAGRPRRAPARAPGHAHRNGALTPGSSPAGHRGSDRLDATPQLLYRWSEGCQLRGYSHTLLTSIIAANPLSGPPQRRQFSDVHLQALGRTRRGKSRASAGLSKSHQEARRWPLGGGPPQTGHATSRRRTKRPRAHSENRLS